MMTRVPAPYVIEPVTAEAFGQNAYVAWREGEPLAVVVDPGFDPGAILRVLRQYELGVGAILNTHGHLDHIAGNAALKEAFPDAPLLIGRNEAHLLRDPEANMSATFGVPIASPPADRLVDDGERVEVCGFAFRVLEIPGHSPGSVVYLSEDDEPPFAFVGDVLFAGSVGRVDFPGGSGEQLVAGIRTKLFSLPPATIVLPGHGPATTVGREREANPYVGERPGLYGLD